MKKTIASAAIGAFAVLALGTGVAVAEEPDYDFSSPSGQIDCSWGEWTRQGLMGESLDGEFSAFDDPGYMGEHSSDPSGDGKGPGSSDEPRVGIGNLVDGVPGETSPTEAICAAVASAAHP